MNTTDSSMPSSEVIDNKVVELNLDIDKFQKHAHDVIGSLNDLNKSLDLDSKPFVESTNQVIDNFKKIEDSTKFKMTDFRSELDKSAESVKSFNKNLKFDVEGFKSGIRDTINLVNRMKSALTFENFYSSAKNFISSFQTDVNNINMNSVQSAAENINSTFTLWGSAIQEVRQIAARFIAKELTVIPRKISGISKTIFGLIKNGGVRRALNLESAKFQLNGIGIAWKNISEDIDYGVKDTAYGLDSAAKAAGRLAASGVQLGDDMKAALRGISGVAAMANTDYDRVALVYSQIAATGKLMGQDLMQLNSLGLNITATIAKQLGKTTQEVRDMISRGEIDFMTFAKAMDAAYGEHAKDSNKTFEGALSNAKAALSRIGADIATPFYENARDILNSTREFVNEFKKTFQPILDAVGQIIDTIGEKMSKFIGGYADALKTMNENKEEPFKGLENTLLRIDAFLNSEAFDEIVKTLGTIISFIGEVIGKIVYVAKTINAIVSPVIQTIFGLIIRNVDDIISILKPEVTGFIEFFRKLLPILEPVMAGIADGILYVTMAVRDIGKIIASHKTMWEGLANTASNFIAPIAGTLYKAIVTIFQVLINIGGQIVLHKESIAKLIVPIITWVVDSLRFTLLHMMRIANFITFLATQAGKYITPVITRIYKIFVEVHKLAYGLAKGLEGLFITMWTTIVGPMDDAIDTVMGGILDGLNDVPTFIRDVIGPNLKAFFQNAAYMLGFTFGSIKKIFTMAGDGLEGIGSLLGDGIFGILKVIFTISRRIVQTLSFLTTGKFVDDNGNVTNNWLGMIQQDLCLVLGLGIEVKKFFSEKFGGIFKPIKDGFTTAFAFIVSGFLVVVGTISSGINTLRTKFTKFGKFLAEVFNFDDSSFSGISKLFEGGILSGIKGTFNSIKSYITGNVVPSITSAFSRLKKFLGDTFGPELNVLITKAWIRASDRLMQGKEDFGIIGNYFVDVIAPKIRGAFNTVKTFITEKAIPAIVVAFTYLKDNVFPIVKDTFINVFNFASEKVNQFKNYLTELGKSTGVGGEGFEAGWNVLSQVILPNIGRHLKDIFTTVKGFISKYWPIVKEKVPEIFGIIKDSLIASWPYIKNIFTTVAPIVKELAVSASGAFLEFIKSLPSILSGLSDFLSKAFSGVDFSGGFTDGLFSLIKSITTIIYTGIGKIEKALFGGISTLLSDTSSKVESTTSKSSGKKGGFGIFSLLTDAIFGTNVSAAEIEEVTSNSTTEMLQTISTSAADSIKDERIQKTLADSGVILGEKSAIIIQEQARTGFQKGLDNTEQIQKILMMFFGPLFKMIAVIVAASTIFKPFKLDGLFKPITELVEEITGPGKAVISEINAKNFVKYSEGIMLISFGISAVAGAVYFLAKEYKKVEDLQDLIPAGIIIGVITAIVTTIGIIMSKLKPETMDQKISTIDKICRHFSKIIRSGLSDIKGAIKAFSASGFLLSFASSVAILAHGIKSFSEVNFLDALYTGAVFFAFIELLSKASNIKMSKEDNLGKIALKFAASVPILAYGLKMFNEVDFWSAVAGLGVFGLFLGELYILQKKLSKNEIKEMQSMSLSFAAMVPLLGFGIKTFNDVDFVTALKMLGTAFGFFIELGILSKMMSSTKTSIIDAIWSLGVTLELILAMGALSLMISGLTLLDQDKLRDVVISLSIIASAFSLMEVASKYTKDASKIGILVLLIEFGLIVAALVGLSGMLDESVISKMQSLSDTIIEVIGIFSLIAVVFGIVTKFIGAGNMVLGALVGGAAVGIVTLIGTAVLGIIGAIGEYFFPDENKDLAYFLENGSKSVQVVVDTVKNVFTTLTQGLGEALGSGTGIALGSLAGSLEGTYNQYKNAIGLEGMEEALTGTGSGIQNLANSVNTNITKDTVNNFNAFADAISKLAGVGYLKETADTIEYALKKLATTLPYFVTTTRGLKDEDFTRINRCIGILGGFATTINSLPETDGLLQKLTGYKNMTGFAESIEALGKGMRAYHDALVLGEDGSKINFDTAVVQSSQKIAEAFAKLENSLPSSNGILQVWTGTKDLKTFAEKLGWLGAGMRNYAKNLGDVDFSSDKLDASVNAAKTLGALEESLPEQDGALQFWAGEKKLGAFAHEIYLFAYWMGKYAEQINGNEIFDEDRSEKTKNLGTFFKDLEKDLPPKNGVVHNFIFGEKNIAVFGENIKSFAGSLKEYGNELAGTNYANIDRATDAITEMLKVFDGVDYDTFSESQYFFNLLVDSILDSLNSDENNQKFNGAGLKIIKEIVKGFTQQEGMEALRDALESYVIAMQYSLNSEESIAIFNKLGTVIIGLIATGIKNAVSTVNDSDAVDAFVSVGQKIVGAIQRGLRSITDELNRLGKYISQGLAIGMVKSDSLKIVQNAGLRVGRNAILGLMKGTKSHSPSKAAEQVGEWVGEGLLIGLDNIEDPVYQRARLIGEGVVEGINEGINSQSMDIAQFGVSIKDFDAEKWVDTHMGLIDYDSISKSGVSSSSNVVTKNTADPASVLRSYGLAEDTVKMVLSAAINLSRPYEEIGEAFKGLNTGNLSFGNFNAIARSVGLNAKQFAKAVYDNTFSNWDDDGTSKKKNVSGTGARAYNSWEELYNAIVSGTGSADMTTGWMVEQLFKNTYHPEFEETIDLSNELLEKLAEDSEESENYLEALLELLDTELEEFKKIIDEKYNNKLKEIDNDIAVIAVDNEKAQQLYMQTINDPNASEGMINAARRNVLINEEGLKSTRRNRALIEKERETEKELADKEYEERKDAIRDAVKNSKKKSKSSKGSSLSWSANDTSFTPEAFEALEDAGQDAGEETAERLKKGLEEGLGDLDREGYDFASAFEDDGWWKKFLDGSESGLAGYDLGSILAGNTISGIEGLFDPMSETGWNLGDFFTQGWEDALNFDSDTEGVGGIINTITTKMDSLLGDVDFSMNSIFGGLGESIGEMVSNIGIDLGGLGDMFEGLKTTAIESLSGIATFLNETFNIDISPLTNFLTEQVENNETLKKASAFVSGLEKGNTGNANTTTSPSSDMWASLTKITDSSITAAINALTANDKNRVAKYMTDFMSKYGMTGNQAAEQALKLVGSTWKQIATNSTNTNNPVIPQSVVNGVNNANNNLVIIDEPKPILTIEEPEPAMIIYGSSTNNHMTKAWSNPSADLASQTSADFKTATMASIASLTNTTSTDLTEISRSINTLSNSVKSINEKMNNTDLRMDGDTVVGTISRRMGRALTTQQRLAARGV